MELIVQIALGIVLGVGLLWLIVNHAKDLLAGLIGGGLFLVGFIFCLVFGIAYFACLWILGTVIYGVVEPEYQSSFEFVNQLSTYLEREVPWVLVVKGVTALIVAIFLSILLIEGYRWILRIRKTKNL
jgi:hypothetical protein